MYPSQKNRKAVWLPITTINDLATVASIDSLGFSNPRKVIEHLVNNRLSLQLIINVIDNKELSMEDAFQQIVDIVK